MHTLKYTLLFLLLFVIPFSGQAAQLKTADYRLSITARTPEQIGAFYEARGFPKQAVNLLKQQCYLTVYFRNTSSKVIWLELDNWQFSTTRMKLQRKDRQYWKQVWTEMGLAMRFQSTFRWTLMPEQLDFRPHEREGGNLILPYTPDAISLQATISILNNNTQQRKMIKMDNIRCKR